MEQHFILCGLGRVGWRVLEFLRAAGARIVVIDNRSSADDPRLAGIQLVQGDCRRPEVLNQAGVGQARGVLILTSDNLVSLATGLTVRQLNPEVRVVVRMFNQRMLARLGKSREVCVLSTSALTGPLLALIARTGAALGSFRLENGLLFQVAEVAVRAANPLVGSRVGDVAGGGRVALVAHLPTLGPGRFLHEVDPEVRLTPGDRLVVCGEPDQLTPVKTRTEDENLPDLLWAGKLRRFTRVGLRTLAEIDLPVKVCAATLISVIVVSTVVFHLTTQHDNIPDALYRTISLMATAADMKGRELEPHGWQQVFVSALRLAGAALTAAFTAILTNYLVRVQLRGALEVRRIPERGHIIVCGLGNVGFRVVEELLRDGERVVVLERSRDNPFIATVRHRGVAVIVGDATVAEVLRQARAPAARAVVAVTSNELTNLEIVLFARELNPTQRVLVRLTDTHLAQTLREAANVRLALSIPDLAAPAFVAALFGDRVHSVFFVEGRLLAAVDLVVGPQDDPLTGQVVDSLVAGYRLQPVCLISQGQTVGPNFHSARLSTGDRLTVIVALADLHRLLQRDRPAVPSGA